MIIHFDYGAKKMDNGKREAARIQKEQESIEIARLVCEIRPVISKIPTDYSGWDIIKTRQFKEFHALATKKINMQRIKLSDIVSIRQQVKQWYGILTTKAGI